MPTVCPNMPTPASIPSPWRLAAFWLGIQAVWGALLGISLQARVLELGGADAVVRYGVLAAAGALTAALVQLGIGPWSDARIRQGGRRVVWYASGSLLAAVGLVAFYGAADWPTLFGAFMVVEIGMNVAIAPYQAIVPESFPPDRVGVASSWMAALQSAGNALGAVIASIAPGASATAAALSALLLGSCAVTSAHAATLPPVPVRPHERLRVGRGFVDLFASRALLYLGFYTLLGYLLFYVSGTLALARAQSVTGILVLIFTLAGVAGAGLAARPSDRADKRLVATIGGGLVALALALLLLTHTIWDTTAASALAGAGWGAFLVADWAIACRMLPAAALATGMAVWNVAVIGPQIAAPALMTVVLQRAGWTAPASAAHAALAFALGETLLGIAWLWRLSRCSVGE